VPEHNGLKLVARPTGRDERKRYVALAAGSMLLLILGVATWLGVGPGRNRPEITGLAQEALTFSLEEGAGSPEVTTRLKQIRAELARTPLDAETRVIYSSLLLGVSRSVAETEAAAFHAVRAAELAPVTVPVQQQAVQVLARCGQLDHALQLTRKTFLFDPDAGAGILERLLPICGQDRATEGIPDTAAAWLAWSRTLERVGRREEAYTRVSLAWERWPTDPGVILYLASRAFSRGDLDHLQALFPEELALPEHPNHAMVFSFQAVAKAAAGDRAGVESAIGTALALLPDNSSVLCTAGDAWRVLEEPDQAAGLWQRSLFHSRHDRSSHVRLKVLLRLARLEDERGQDVDALGYWRKILEEAPDHREARRRVDDLTGFRN